MDLSINLNKVGKPKKEFPQGLGEASLKTF